jgi:hypothetical protein
MEPARAPLRKSLNLGQKVRPHLRREISEGRIR